MRQVIDPQLQFGEQDIGAIVLDPKSRDDIPQLLRGLQHIYTTPELRARVFAILEEVVPAGRHGKADTDTGRPGMEQWKILVLGVLRLGLNTDHDRLLQLANEHKSIRQMLGHTGWADCEEARYEFEISEAAQQASGRRSFGFMVPPDVMQRDLTTTAAQGGYTVATDLMGLIDLLVNKSVIAQSGATMLSGPSPKAPPYAR